MLFGLFRTVKMIAPSEAMNNMKQNKTIVLLDVREESEYKAGHIKGAKLLPLNQISTQINTLGIPKDTILYIYCQSGGRSIRACSMLMNMGYTNVHSLGGILKWPYEIVK